MYNNYTYIYFLIMHRRKVNVDLVITPEYFHQDRLYDYILKSLKEKESTCNEVDGYIDQIYHIVDIKNKGLYDTGQCCVNVTVDADCFIPHIGKEIETTVEMIFPHGIFSSLYILRFLIPFHSLTDHYDYIQHEHLYRHRTTREEIKVGSKIRIEITNLKYDKNHFSCIGKLISS